MALAHYTGLTAADRFIGGTSQPHIYHTAYDVFLGANNLVNSVTSRVLYGLYMNMRVNAPGIVWSTAIIGGNARGHADPPAVWFPNAVGGAAYVVINVNVPLDYINGDITGGHAREIHGFSAHGSTWLAELLCAHAHKQLNPENIVSYFAMVRIRIIGPRPIVLFLDWAVSVMSATANSNNLVALTRSTTWGIYRLNASSVPALYENMRADYGAIVDDILGNNAINAINALAANPHLINLHRAIPLIALAKIYVALEASGGVPNNWYSGTRAVGTINNATRNAWRLGFRRLLEQRYNLANLAATVNEGATIDAVGLRHV